MKYLTFSLLFLMLAALGIPRAAAAEPEPARTKPQYIILKLDDIVQAKGNHDIHPYWQRVTDYLEQNHIKASFGVICQSLEQDNPRYFNWIKQRQASGNVEFWLHGYWLRPNAEGKGEFEQGTAEEQQAVLEKSEKLAQEKLGFTFAAFGPHWSGTTEETEKAMQAVPEIKIWLYGPAKSKYYTKMSLVRVMALENPTFKPDPDKFIDIYNKIGYRQDVLVLQGHPAQWSEDARWIGFTKIIDFLKSKNVVFITPSEYLKLSTQPAAH